MLEDRICLFFIWHLFMNKDRLGNGVWGISICTYLSILCQEEKMSLQLAIKRATYKAAVCKCFEESNNMGTLCSRHLVCIGEMLHV